MLTGLIPRRSVHQWSHLLTPRPLSIITTFCGVPIPSPSPCATYRDLNVPQLSHLDVGDSGGKEGQRISNTKSNYRSARRPSFHRCSNSVSIFPISRARAVSSQMASTSSAPAVAHPEPTIFAESQTSEPDVRTWPPSPPLVLQSSAPGRGFIA